MLILKACTAQGREGEEGGEGKKRARRCVWLGGRGETRFPWSRWWGTTHGHQHAVGGSPSPPHRCGNRETRWAARSADCFWTRSLVHALSWPRLRGMLFFFFNLFFFFFNFWHKSCAKQVSPNHLQPCSIPHWKHKERSGAFSAGLCKQPLLRLRGGVRCERGPVCVPPHHPRGLQLLFWHAPLPPRIGIFTVINLLPSHLERCSGWTGPSVRGQHHITPSSACRPPARPPRTPVPRVLLLDLLCILTTRP